MMEKKIEKLREKLKEFLTNLDDNLRLFCREVRKDLREERDYVIAITGYPGCQPTGSKVLMANGLFKNIEDINIGDEIISPQINGENIFSKVMNTSSWNCKEIYNVVELNRNHKKLYSCSYNHLIPLYIRKIPRINGIRNSKNKQWIIDNQTAEDFSNVSNHTKQRIKIGFSSFLINKFKGRINCKIEPYSLGVYLGDGCFSSVPKNNRKNKRNVSITSADFEILKEVSKYYPIMNIYQKKNTPAKSYIFSLNSPFVSLLSKYGLEGKGSEEKFIPKEALYSDAEYRKKLLAGLIDTDGYYNSGGFEITSKSKQLIEDINFLVYSLGGRAYTKKVKKTIKSINFSGEYHYIRIYLHNLKLPLKIKRKEKNVKSVYLSSNRLAIDSIKTNNSSKVYGLEIDSPSKLYITDNFMVTHNTGKSQLGAVMGSLIDFDYDFKKNICFIPTSKEIENSYMKLPMYSALHIDEASRGLHKQKWYDKVQQKLNELYDVEREGHFLCTLLLMPRFQNFSENFRNFRIKYWINIVERGIAIVYKRDEDKDAKDPWHIDENYKLKLKRWKGQKIFSRDIPNVVRIEQQTLNYWFYFKIPEIPKEIWAEYQLLKKDSRVVKEEDNEIESYRDKMDREKLEKWNQIIVLKKEGKSHSEIGVSIGVSAETVRRHLRQIEAYEKMKGKSFATQIPSKKVNIIFSKVPTDDFNGNQGGS
jgi:hypothetical protein